MDKTDLPEMFENALFHATNDDPLLGACVLALKCIRMPAECENIVSGTDRLCRLAKDIKVEVTFGGEDSPNLIDREERRGLLEQVKTGLRTGDDVMLFGVCVSVLSKLPQVSVEGNDLDTVISINRLLHSARILMEKVRSKASGLMN